MVKRAWPLLLLLPAGCPHHAKVNSGNDQLVAAKPDAAGAEDVPDDFESVGDDDSNHRHVIKLDEVEVRGELQPLLHVLGQRLPELQFCFREQKPHLPPAVKLQIDASGHVLDAATKNIPDGPIRDCVLDVVKATAFPTVPGGGSIDVSYTIKLKP
jgi:hypothetical protein